MGASNIARTGDKDMLCYYEVHSSNHKRLTRSIWLICPHDVCSLNMDAKNGRHPLQYKSIRESSQSMYCLTCSWPVSPSRKRNEWRRYPLKLGRGDLQTPAYAVEPSFPSISCKVMLEFHERLAIQRVAEAEAKAVRLD